MTFAELPVGKPFIFLIDYRPDVPLSTVFWKINDSAAEAEQGSPLGMVRVTPDAMVAAWPEGKASKLK